MKHTHTHILIVLAAALLAGCTTGTQQRPADGKTVAEEQDPNAPAMGPLGLPMR